jgi:PEP-CTERM motif
MIKFTSIIKTSVSMLAAVAASSAMAFDGIAMLNTGVLTANSMTASSLGLATYTASSGELRLPIDQTGTTSTLVDFGLNDGFKASGGSGILAYTVSFTDLQFTKTGLLTGVMTGGGIVSSLGYTGDLLQAATLTPTDTGLIASNFSVTPSFQSYLTSAGATASLITTVGSLVTSINVPEPGTYALMGLGLVGIAFVSKRRSQA